MIYYDKLFIFIHVITSCICVYWRLFWILCFNEYFFWLDASYTQLELYKNWESYAIVLKLAILLSGLENTRQRGLPRKKDHFHNISFASYEVTNNNINVT